MLSSFLSSESGLSSGGTISGHLTIEGDLTVTGAGAGYAYSEVLTGDMKITNTAATIGLEIAQSGNNIALKIDQDDADKAALYIDAETTTHRSIEMFADALTTGSGAFFYSASANTGAFKVVEIKNDHASATGAKPLSILQNSTGRGIDIDINNSATTAFLDSKGIYLDYDKSGVVADGVTSALYGFDLDIDDAATNHANATVTMTGGRINVTSANAQGTLKNVGLDVTVSGADTNYAALFNGGNVGIGDISPDDLLHINWGSTNDGGLKLETTTNAVGIDFHTGSGTGKNFRFANNSVAHGTFTLFISDSTGGSPRGGGGAATALMNWDANSRISLSNNDAGTSNTLFGYLAGEDLVSGGNQNTLIGHNVGKEITNADGIVGIGYGALVGGISSDAEFTVAIGHSALAALTSGIGNVAIGYQSMDANTASDFNTAVGHQALSGVNGSGIQGNTAVGRQAGLAVTDGIGNTIMGAGAGDAITSADYNVFIGYYSGSTTVDADRCVAIGNSAMEAGNATQDGTVAIGDSALANLTSGARNVALGYSALAANQAGDDNIAIGYNALVSGGAAGADLDKNIAIGVYALDAADGAEANNIAIGYSAMGNLNNSSATRNMAIGNYAADGMGSGLVHVDNVFMGYDAGGGSWENNLSSSNVGVGNYVMDAAMDGALHNIAVGFHGLGALTQGDGNIAMGSYAGSNITTGSSNIAIGAYDGTESGALGTNTVGDYNIAIGSGALTTANDDSNDGTIAIGYGACKLQVGNGSSAQFANSTVGIGYQALTALTSGAGNIAVGYQAADTVGTGNYNTIVGYNSLGSANTAANHNTTLGFQTMLNCNSATTTDNIAIGRSAMTGGGDGNMTGCIAIGSIALDDTTGEDHIGTIAIGHQALTACTSGASNTAVGYNAGLSITTGGENTILGHLAGDAIGIGNSNTLVGQASGGALADGDNNTAIGASALASDTDGQGTVAVGTAALGYQNITSEGLSYNTGLGYQAGNNNQTGTNNTWVGYRSGYGATNQSNSNNVGVGSNALGLVTSGSGNTAIGKDAGDSITTCNNTVLIGRNAGQAITVSGSGTVDPDGTIAIGSSALTALTTGARNVALGYFAGSETTVGIANIAIGFQAMLGDGALQNDSNIAIGSAHPTGSVLGAMGGQWASNPSTNNIAIGTGSMAGVMNGSNNNTAVGHTALAALTTGDNNTVIGTSAFKAAGADEQSNVIIGANCANVFDEGTNGTIDHNIAIGADAFTGADLGTASVAVHRNIAIGSNALNSTADNAQEGTIAIGYDALTALTSGVDNVGVGYQTMLSVTGGQHNAMLGDSTGKAVTAGTSYSAVLGSQAFSGSHATQSDHCVSIGYNALSGALDNADGTVAIGSSALSALTSGASNTAVGYTAMNDVVEGARNTALGYNAFGGALDTTADASNDNTFIGFGAGAGAWVTAVSNANTAVGSYALQANLNGALSNTCIGESSLAAVTEGNGNSALGNQSGDAITTGSNNTCIGFYSDAVATVDNQIAIGANTATDGANKIRLGNASIVACNIQVDWTVDSDSRIKKDIENSDIGLSFVNSLKTRKYKKKHPSEYDAEILEARYKQGGTNYDDDKDEIIKDEFDDDKVLNGLIAQEVKAVMDDLDVEFSGWSEDTKGKQGIQYATLVVPLIKAVQELSAKVEALENK